MLSLESRSVFFSTFASVLFCYIKKSLNDWSLGEHRILFPSTLNVRLGKHRDSPETKFTVTLGTSH